MSGSSGKTIKALTIDHKPSEENERKRIIEQGGKIYQYKEMYVLFRGQMTAVLPYYSGKGSTSAPGPYRVLPGRLSVSRTLGDIEAKMPKYGGNPNVVIPTPDIFSFRLTSEQDFIFLGCNY